MKRTSIDGCLLSCQQLTGEGRLPALGLCGLFPLSMRSTVNAQVVTANHIQIPPFKFKLLLWNDTGFQGTSVTLDAEVYDEEIQ